MIRLSFFISILFVGLSMAIARNAWKSPHLHQKRSSTNKEQTHHLRQLMGNLIDTDTNIEYAMSGHKQDAISSNLDMTTRATSKDHPALAYFQETACIAACNMCVEEHPLEKRKKKKAADNCGPMCDCADSCLVTSADEVGQIYGQNSDVLNEKNCWWNTYNEFLNNGFPSIP